jgi:hypothetical protein
VDSPDQWRAILRDLIESPQLRSTVAGRARQDVRANHSTVAAAPALEKTIRELARRAPSNSPLTINWVVNPAESQDEMALDLACGLAERGHRVRVSLHSAERASADVIQPLGQELKRRLEPDIEVQWHASLPPADVSIATDWRVAEYVHRDALSPFKVHLVRKQQPERYAQQSRVARESERVYELSLRIVCTDPAVAQSVRTVTPRPIECLDAAAGSMTSQLERILLEMCCTRLAGVASRR